MWRSHKRRFSSADAGGEFDAIVHAEHASEIVRDDRGDVVARAHEMRDRVGEIVFALRVFVRELRARRAQLRFVVGIEAGVHLVERELVLRRIARFDDARDVRAVAHDTSEARRQRHARRDEGERVFARGDRAHDEFDFDERHVAVEHEQRAAGGFEARERHLHRVARTELRLLQHAAHARVTGRAGDRIDVLRELAVRHHGHVGDAGVA